MRNCVDWTAIFQLLAADINDATAWEMVQQQVRGWARAHLRRQPWHIVEDVVADTCSSVAVAFDRARAAESFGGFVYGLYLNQRRRALNDLQHPFHSHVDIDALDVAARVEDTVSDNEVPVVDFEGVWRALARLPQRERTAVSLRYFERLPAHAIARELGITPGNARRIVHNGLVHLRAQLRSPSAELVQTGWPPRR